VPRHSHVALGNLSGVCSGVRSLGMRGVACLTSFPQLLVSCEERKVRPLYDNFTTDSDVRKYAENEPQKTCPIDTIILYRRYSIRGT
jgi:hypothetical protein